MISRNELNDPFEILKLYRYLRVADVCDGMDGIGYFNIGLVDPEIRPLWEGMKFWGVAFTVRCVPANKPMWPLESTDDVVDAHSIWFDKMGTVRFEDQIKPGHVVVMDAGSSREVGFWGSNNAMAITRAGGVGIVTNGCARDTGELCIQRSPLCCRMRGRTIIPGRIETVEVQAVIGVGGAQVRPGDIVGCDDDGVVVVPVEVARQVAVHARSVLLSDIRGRKKLYAVLGKTPDETVDEEIVVKYYEQLK